MNNQLPSGRCHIRRVSSVSWNVDPPFYFKLCVLIGVYNLTGCVADFCPVSTSAMPLVYLVTSFSLALLVVRPLITDSGGLPFRSYGFLVCVLISQLCQNMESQRRLLNKTQRYFPSEEFAHATYDAVTAATNTSGNVEIFTGQCEKRSSALTTTVFKLKNPMWFGRNNFS